MQAKLFALAEATGLKEKLAAMAAGEHINVTEDRAVMHVALRAKPDATFTVDGKNVVPDVHAVLDRIRDFSDRVRSGAWKGVTGKPLTDIVSIGIGGSYLGPEFVFEALKKGALRCCEPSVLADAVLTLLYRQIPLRLRRLRVDACASSLTWTPPTFLEHLRAMTLKPPS